MTGPSSPGDVPLEKNQGSKPSHDGTVADNSGTGRRDVLSVLRNAAIAVPVLLTLKSAPARALTASAAGSATHASHLPQDT